MSRIPVHSKWFTLLPLALCLASQLPAAPTPLTTATQIIHLTRAEADSGLPVKIRGVVLYADVKVGFIFFHHASGPQFTYFDPTGSEPELFPGDEIIVQGVTTAGNYSPCIKNGKFQRLGHSQLPLPLHRSFEDLTTGQWVGYWAELSGIITTYTVQAESIQYSLHGDGGTAVVIVKGKSHPIEVGSRVTMRGALGALYNARRQSLGIKFFVPGTDYITIVKAAPADLFATPEAPLEAIGTFEPTADRDLPVRIVGKVTAVEAPSRIYLSDNSVSVVAEALPSACWPQPETMIELVGFRGYIEGRPGLVSASCRPAQGQVQPFATKTTVKEILALKSEPESDPTFLLHLTTKFDLKLLEVEGTLLKASVNPVDTELLMTAQGGDFTAFLPRSGAALAQTLEPGSVLRLTGICLLSYDSYHRPESFRLLLSGPSAVTAIARASWWTPARLITLLGAVAAIALLAAAWIVLLRKRVRHQTATINQQLQRMAELKQRAEEASVVKSQFLANMSHEIRTPMNGVLGMTALALETQNSGEQRELVEMAHYSAQTLLALINDILDLSKIEAGKLDVDPVPISLSEMLSGILKPLSFRAHEKHIALLCRIAPGVPDHIVIDPVRLGQILTNLLGNAIKFTATGEVELAVRIAGASGHSKVLQFEVRDTGIGIPKDRQQAIFEAFSQADLATTRHFGGTGLGLTISTRLVELMGGRMWVESAPGEGSTFFFTVEAAFETAAAPKPHSILQGVPVLILDENATSREILAEIVSTQGMQPALAATPEQARTIGVEFPIAVMDAGLISNFAPKIIALTTVGRMETNNAQVAAKLSKPYLPAQVIEALTTALSETAPAKASPAQQALTSNLQEGFRVLLAEDNRVNQEVARRILESRGCEVVIASNGLEALEAFKASSYNAVLMDLQMPVLGGIEATEQIRAYEAGHSHTPILALTADAMSCDRDRCLSAGMDAFLTKPIHPELLLAELSRLQNTSVPL